MNRMEYHADPAVGSSALACALRSAREYEAQFINRTLSVTETDAMRFGTLVHLRILEPDKYAERVVRIPPDVLSKSGSRAGQAWKEWQSQQQAAGNVIVTDAEHDRIQGIAESIERTPIARYVVESIEHAEQPLRWTCEQTGVQCKGMIDAALSSGVLVDIKTTTDVSWEGFRRKVISSMYHVQAAHYLDGYRAARGWWWLACQTSPPYLVRVYEAADDMLERGQTLRLVGLERIKRGQQSGDWADREEREVIPLTLPSWERMPLETEDQE
jgi:hypothetical protein